MFRTTGRIEERNIRGLGLPEWFRGQNHYLISLPKTHAKEF